MTFMFKPWWNDGRLTIEELLQGIAGAGAGGIEPFHLDFVEDPGLIQRYRRSMADTGLRAPVVDVMCNLVYSDNRSRMEGRDALRQGLDVCHELGAQVAHVAGHRLLPGISPSDGRKMIAEGLTDALDSARAAGITLGIENFKPSPDLICSAADCLEIMQLSGDAVRFVFDTGNFMSVDEDPAENFDMLADRICHCHFKEYVKDAESPEGHSACDLGKGDIPNAEVARKLRACGYEGWVALETRSRNDLDPVAAVQSELPLLKSWFNL